MIILPPLAGLEPEIEGLADKDGTVDDFFNVGDTIRINGKNFDLNATDFKVKFGSEEVKLMAAEPNSSTRLYVEAPRLVGHSASDTVDTRVTVSFVDGNGELRESKEDVPVTLYLLRG